MTVARLTRRRLAKRSVDISPNWRPPRRLPLILTAAFVDVEPSSKRPKGGVGLVPRRPGDTAESKEGAKRCRPLRPEGLGW